MATKRTTKKSVKDEISEIEHSVQAAEQEKINQSINDAFQTGKEQGALETAQRIEDILKQRSAILFLNKNDDIAKEIRDISLSIKESLISK